MVKRFGGWSGNRFVSALIFSWVAMAMVARADGGIISVAPTVLTASLLRGGQGVFGAPRSGGKTHSGVDIVANQSSMDKNTYQVVAVADGVVAYAKVNGEGPGEGYGYTVIIDHGNGTYTLYAHLATVASASLVNVGDTVVAGKVVGYMADLANGEGSSGNVIANSVPSYDKIQLHFEEFQAPSGRSSLGAIGPIKKDAVILDPTSDLTNHGYKASN
jgi:murein DD-endopeptidase MepM/ murein hydrolase activator NlpD